MRLNRITAMLAMAAKAPCAVLAGGSRPSHELCQELRFQEQGDWYCKQVQRITYENLGLSGQYNEVVNMDQGSGGCTFAPRQFSGPMAPLNEPVSLHFRGPLNLKQVAVYLPGAPATQASESQVRKQKSRENQGQRRGLAPDHSENLHTAVPDSAQPMGQAPEEVYRTDRFPKGIYVSLPGIYGYGERFNRSLVPNTNLAHVSKRAESLSSVQGVVTVTSVVTEKHTTTLSPVSIRTTITLTGGFWRTSSSNGISCVTGTTLTQSTATSLTRSSSSSSSSLLSSASGDGPACDGAITSPLTMTTLARTSSSTATTMAPSSANTRTASLPYSSASASTGVGTAGQFVRAGYYNAARQRAEGLMFQGNYGGQGSGKWTPKFGNTLSYINADGTGGAGQPNVLKDVTLLPSHEASLFTDTPCDSSCDYVQNGSVAYKGFAGTTRIFLLEFSMPHNAAAATGTSFNSPKRPISDTPSPPSSSSTPSATAIRVTASVSTSTDPGSARSANTTQKPPQAGAGPGEDDRPAIWLLNARIPHTAQYHACNCWASGCGGLDVFKVLAPGGERATTGVKILTGSSHSSSSSSDSFYYSSSSSSSSSSPSAAAAASSAPSAPSAPSASPSVSSSAAGASSSTAAARVARDPNWFARPVDASKPMRLAVVLDGEAGDGQGLGRFSVTVLAPKDGGAEFPAVLDRELIARMRGQVGTGWEGESSVFRFD